MASGVRPSIPTAVSAALDTLRRSAGMTDGPAAIRLLSETIGNTDHWLLRFERGKAYLRAGYTAEALDEFERCQSRIGEATALLLDGLPSLRHAGELPYWTALAQSELGMDSAATVNYQLFIDRRGGDPLADDARQRIR